MMGKTRSFQEAKATLNGSILVGSLGTTYSGLLFSLSNLNLCNDIEEGQMEEYKKKDRQREGWPFSLSNLNLCNDIEEGQMEEYKKKERQRESGCLGWSNANICNEIEKGQTEEYKKKETQKEAKETPIANRELMEEITNDERNDMEEEQMEEIEIKEGHDDVEEEQDNKITMPIFNFCGNLLNEERGQVERNKIEEGQEEVQEEQDNERAKQDRYLRRRFRLDCQRDQLMLSTMPKLIYIEIEPTEITEEQLGRQLFISEEQLGRQLFWDPFEKKMGIRSILFQGGQSRRELYFQGVQSRRKLFFRMGRNKRVQWETEKERKYLEISGRNDMTQHAAPQQSGKLIDVSKNHGGFDDTEKGGGKRAICADCHLEPRPGQVAGQTNDVATQTVPVCEPGEDIFRRNDMTQLAAPQQSGKLIDVTEDQCEFDDTEKDIQELEQLLRCKVCLDSDACIVFLPCRHMATCEYCEGFLHHCPVCRSFIEEAVKINEE